MNRNTDKGLVIRPFTLKDVDFIISSQLELYEVEHGFTSDIWKAYLTDGVHELVTQFDSKKDCVYVLEYNEVPSGCAAVTHVDDLTAKFRFFFVDSKLRGWGAGHLLLDICINFYKEKKYKHVHLWTFSTLKAARPLYKSKGFNISETRENNEWGTHVIEELWKMDLKEQIK